MIEKTLQGNRFEFELRGRFDLIEVDLAGFYCN